MTLTKAGKTVEIVVGGLSGTGRVPLKRCKCPQCAGSEAPFVVLPCGCHHAILVRCTCKLREVKCARCGRVFMPAGGDWYEVEDPHGPRVSL